MAKAKIGRPTTYTPEIAAIICGALEDGATLLDICERPGMPTRRTVNKWLHAHPAFVPMYARAREQQAHALWDEAVQGARDAHDKDSALCARVKADVLTKLASKLNRQVYGEKLDIESNSHVTVADNTDRPPRETRDQWTARRAKELGVDRRLLGAPAGHSD